ncbi:accessory factor UbiK family protein [Acetobacter sp. AN02]|uniref:accessory factor UbiK family protein n=1 Tax=Acetobacter sp. AN02 TaxID=2894186 RepID=UPI0024345906|nr:accessory factor UbiK family protein [Acetobacter sp. AN02]MDG6095700.1 accessory factor UbiK family protein [Acetobacter sp. AN02]
MPDKPRFFDDLAGIAGGAISALSGAKEEINAIVRARVDEVLAQLQVVRREEFDIVREMAVLARSAQEDAESRISALEQRISELERNSSHQNGGFA